MALRSDLSGAACPIARGSDILADPWVLLILREVFAGNRRFDGIARETGGAESVISKRLALLVDAGVLGRRPYRDNGRERAEYVLTDAGADVLPVLHALARWGDEHVEPPVAGMHLRIVCLGCGEEPPSADWCPTCAHALTVRTTGWGKARTPDVLVELGAV